MNRYIVGYCKRCGEKTRHKIIESKESIAWRIFETVVTAGFALLCDHDYECECVKCGKIKTLSK